jgi:hypothetical protein
MIVLDINGVLVDRQRISGSEPKLRPDGSGPDFVVGRSEVFLRPHVAEFCNFLLDSFEVVVWSSMVTKNVHALVPHAFGARAGELRAILDQRDCITTGTVPSGRGGTKPRFAKPLDRVS